MAHPVYICIICSLGTRKRFSFTSLMGINLRTPVSYFDDGKIETSLIFIAGIYFRENLQFKIYST